MVNLECGHCGSVLKKDSSEDDGILWSCPTDGCGFMIHECGNAVNQFEDVNGNISIRMAKSLHKALLVEADSEGVSLNQLCTTKLSRQLKTLILGEENA